MPRFRLGLRQRLLTVAVLLLAVGCTPPLARQQEYFARSNDPAAEARAAAQHTVGHFRALQAAQHACARTPVPDVPSPDAPSRAEPGPDAAAARAALAELCATAPRPPPGSARGPTLNAHQRWVQGEVRELPDASRTAASAGGGP